MGGNWNESGYNARRKDNKEIRKKREEERVVARIRQIKNKRRIKKDGWQSYEKKKKDKVG